MADLKAEAALLFPEDGQKRQVFEEILQVLTKDFDFKVLSAYQFNLRNFRSLSKADLDATLQALHTVVKKYTFAKGKNHPLKLGSWKHLKDLDPLPASLPTRRFLYWVMLTDISKQCAKAGEEPERMMAAFDALTNAVEDLRCLRKPISAAGITALDFVAHHVFPHEISRAETGWHANQQLPSTDAERTLDAVVGIAFLYEIILRASGRLAEDEPFKVLLDAGVQKYAWLADALPASTGSPNFCVEISMSEIGHPLTRFFHKGLDKTLAVTFF